MRSRERIRTIIIRVLPPRLDMLESHWSVLIHRQKRSSSPMDLRSAAAASWMSSRGNGIPLMEGKYRPGLRAGCAHIGLPALRFLWVLHPLISNGFEARGLFAAQKLTLLQDATLLQLTETLLPKSGLRVFVPPPGFQHIDQRVRRPPHTVHHP